MFFPFFQRHPAASAHYFNLHMARGRSMDSQVYIAQASDCTFAKSHCMMRPIVMSVLQSRKVIVASHCSVTKSQELTLHTWFGTLGPRASTGAWSNAVLAGGFHEHARYIRDFTFCSWAVILRSNYSASRCCHDQPRSQYVVDYRPSVSALLQFMNIIYAFNMIV